MPARFPAKPRRIFDQPPAHKPAKPKLTKAVGKLPAFDGYQTGATTKGKLNIAPSLEPAKYQQRLELTQGMPKGTILEMHAGRGNLTKAVYQGKASKHILIDKDPEELDQALKRLQNHTPIEAYAMDNVKWAQTLMNPDELKDLVLVDFDPFGNPAPAIKAFFENYKVKKPLRIAVTDGSWLYTKWLSETPRGKKWVKENFLVDLQPGTREKQIEIMNQFMEQLGKKYGFKVEPINAHHGSTHANYLGYLVKPA